LLVGLLLPLEITSTLLLAFLPRGLYWWEYLDVIENALDAAEESDLSLLPALMLRSQRVMAAKREITLSALGPPSGRNSARHVPDLRPA
jgi:hypothetical protein